MTFSLLSHIIFFIILNRDDVKLNDGIIDSITAQIYSSFNIVCGIGQLHYNKLHIIK